MPMYPWLLEDQLDISNTADKINAMRTLGVPYQKGYDKIANDDLMAQAKQIADELNAEEDINTSADKEIIALIAYLQRLGTDILVDK